MSASTLRVSHDQRKRELVNELNIVLKAAASHRRPNKEPLAAELTANLCAVVEALLIHGLRDPFFLRGSRYAKYPEPNLWPFVSKFTHRSVTTQIHALNLIKTEIGKSRAWVRIVLNEGGLEHYLGVLGAEKKALGQFYLEEAFIRDSEQVERIKDMLKSLNSIVIHAPTNSALLNSWTPSPLILAGLVDGKPLRVGQHTTHRRISSKEDTVTEETGICALELLPSSSSPSSSAPLSSSLKVPLSISMASNGAHVASSPSPQSMLFLRAGLQKPSPRGRFEEGDDNSSVYSHPSMVADCRPTTMSAGGGHRSPVMDTTSDGLVQRRTKRRRNMSRSSSDGSGSGQLRTAAANAAAAAEKQTTRPESTTTAASDVVEEEEEVRRGKECAVDGETEARRRRRENSGERRDSGVESEVNNASLSGCPTISSSNEETEEKDKKEEEGRKEEVEQQSEEAEPVVHREEESETMFNMSGDGETMKEKEGKEGKEEEERTPESASSAESTTKKEEEEKKEDDEYVEEHQMASSSSVVPPPPQPLEDEGIASLSGNSLQGRSWRHGHHRYASSIAGSSMLAPTDAAELQQQLSFEGAEMGISPRDLPPALSTSSDTDGSPAPVSFGAALRKHVVQQSGGTDVLIRKRDFSDSTEDGEDEPEDEEMMMARKEAEEQETLRKLTEIATEEGLDAQEFRCIMCKSTIGLPSYRAYSVCGLDARYYCSECWQQGAERVVPSRMVASWDVRTRKVSPRSRVFLDSIGDKPLLHINKTNPSLYLHSAAMREVKELREKLQLVAMYLFNCRESVAADLRRRLAPKEYFIDDVHLYSYNDLLSVVSGSMARQLKIMLKFAIGHVFDCNLCSQKGFLCEMCNDGSVIYPFQTEITHRCGECYSVCHIACFERTQECVKCERRRKHSATRREATHLEIDC